MNRKNIASTIGIIIAIAVFFYVINYTENEFLYGDDSYSVDEYDSHSLEYADGVYSSDAEYQLPNGGSHTIHLKLTLESNLITHVETYFTGDVSGGSRQIQAKFKYAMKEEVVGASVDSISLSRTGGASLSSRGFNRALASIKGQAK